MTQAGKHPEDGMVEIEVDLEDDTIEWIENRVREEHAAGNTEVTFNSIIVDALKSWLDEVEKANENES